MEKFYDDLIIINLYMMTLLMTIFSVQAPLCNWKAIVKKALMQQKLPLLKIIQLFRPLKVTRLVNNLYPSMDM